MIAALMTVVAFAVALAVTRQICQPGSWLHVLDHPNERSLHTRAVPRTGGVAILVGVAVAALLYIGTNGAEMAAIGVAAASVIVAVVSFIDDRQGLSVRARLFGQVGSALLVVGSGLTAPGLGLPGTVWAWPLALAATASALYLVWMINLYNFMDGMDGFAGGMAMIGFGTLAVLGALAGNTVFVAVSLAIAAASAGFLVFNFPPARIFMGDSGSATLGLLAGSLSIWGARDGVFPFWVALLVFSPFIVDATVTLVRRLLRGERVWQAHKTHYYQRLVQSGWGHRKTVLHEYGLMLACGLAAVLTRFLGPTGQWLVIASGIFVYVALMVVVFRIEKAAAK